MPPIDVMLLHRGTNPEPLIQTVLYPLWGANLKVGHAVRSVAESRDAGRDRLDTHTSLLSAAWWPAMRSCSCVQLVAWAHRSRANASLILAPLPNVWAGFARLTRHLGRLAGVRLREAVTLLRFYTAAARARVIPTCLCDRSGE